MDGYAVEGEYREGAYSPGESSAAWRHAGNVTAYARWTPNEYTVILDVNGGSVSGAPSVTAQVVYGQNASQAAAHRTVSRPGYVFVGWYDTSAPSGGNMVFDANGYAVGGKYREGAYSPGVSSAAWNHAGNVTAYARWASNTYTVTLDANGGG